MNLYEYWLTFDEATKNELESITDKAELEDRFYKDLEFGTGGLRGVMGAGANRMNKYTVSKATKGLADYLNACFDGEKSVAIAFDSRNNSQYFAGVAAGVLCKAGINNVGIKIGGCVIYAVLGQCRELKLKLRAAIIKGDNVSGIIKSHLFEVLCSCAKL